MVGLLGRYDGRIGGHGEVDTREWYQVGFELGQVDVDRATEAQRGRYRADDLRDQTIQVLIARSVNVQVAAANVVDGLVVHLQ